TGPRWVSFRARSSMPAATDAEAPPVSPAESTQRWVTDRTSDTGRRAGRPEGEIGLMGVTRRAKIVCTLGPATSSPERIRGLVEAGMDVARLNFSHGSHAEHERVYRLVREAAREAGRPLAILADLQGPKVRLGRFADGPHEWRTGDTVIITSEDILGTRDRVSCSYKKLPQEVKIGDRLLIDDGKVTIEVTS